MDTVKNYYPNGKLYNVLKIESKILWNNDISFTSFIRDDIHNYKLQIIELRDSTGKVLAQNGQGHVLIYDDDFKNLIEEGNIKNNKKEEEWKGMIADSGKFICTFHKDVLKSGISYMKSGHHYEFKEIYQRPVFNYGQVTFDYFINKNLKYPESARKYKMTGYVMIEFYVEQNGMLSDVKVSQGLIKSLDDEAVRVVSLSPLWYPATKYGILLRTRQTVFINFYDAYYRHTN